MFFNRKKEPEKEKPNFTGQQHAHKACVIVFDNSKAIKSLDELKRQYDKCSVTSEKTTTRLKAMIQDCEEISTHHMMLQRGCLTSLNIASSYSEMMAMQMGLVPTNEMQGFSLCPGCLEQAIFACQEVVRSLKDIQEATKDYV